MAIVALVLCAMEAAVRVILIPASADLARLASHRSRARSLCGHGQQCVVFVGNSVTDKGIDPALFARLIRARSDVFVADASHVNTWIWIINHAFWEPRIAPDLVILTFYEDALYDGRLDLGRLAFFLTNRSDWPEVFHEDVRSLESRAAFLLSSVSATYATRDRIKERALTLVPGYKPYVTMQNGVNFRAGRPSQSSSTHQALIRLLAKARQHQTPLAFVAFPTLRRPGEHVAYEVPEETRRLITAAGMVYLDMRDVRQLDRVHYEDNVHLTAQGRAIYTRHLAETLRDLRTSKGTIASRDR